MQYAYSMTFSDEFISIGNNYFKVTYIRRVPAQGRKRAVKPCYTPNLWNIYGGCSALQGIGRINNASKGRHNPFQLLVGKFHPSMYSFLNELQKEEASIEYILQELDLGKKVKKSLLDIYNGQKTTLSHKFTTIIGTQMSVNNQNISRILVQI